MRYYFLALLIIFLTVGCNTYSDDQKNTFDSEISAFIEKENLSMEKSGSGLYFEIIEEGEGEPIMLTSYVTLTYKTRLLDGTVVDENQTREGEEAFKYLVNQLIVSWQEVLVSVKQGAKVRLISPPQLGYGQQDLDDIPPHSILDCEFEVVKVE